MKLFPHELTKKHVGLICVVHHSSTYSGHIGHSQAHGLESGSVTTSFVTIGRLCMITDEKLTFLNSAVSSHASDLSWSLGPRINEASSYLHEVDRKNLHSNAMVVVNTTEASNAVRQHLLRSRRTKGLWAIGKRLLHYIPNI